MVKSSEVQTLATLSEMSAISRASKQSNSSDIDPSGNFRKKTLYVSGKANTTYFALTPALAFDFVFAEKGGVISMFEVGLVALGGSGLVSQAVHLFVSFV